MRLLIQLTETDKRVLFALFIIVILLLVLIGYLGFLVTRVMKIQGAKLDTKVYDQIKPVLEDDAYESAHLLGKYEGTLVGISSGAALFAGIELAKLEENKDKNIVVLLPDSGDRYLSTPLFKD